MGNTTVSSNVPFLFAFAFLGSYCYSGFFSTSSGVISYPSNTYTLKSVSGTNYYMFGGTISRSQYSHYDGLYLGDFPDVDTNPINDGWTFFYSLLPSSDSFVSSFNVSLGNIAPAGEDVLNGMEVWSETAISIPEELQDDDYWNPDPDNDDDDIMVPIGIITGVLLHKIH